MGLPYSRQINAAFEQVTPLVAAGFKVLRTTRDISILLAVIQVLTVWLLFCILLALVGVLFCLDPGLEVSLGLFSSSSSFSSQRVEKPRTGSSVVHVIHGYSYSDTSSPGSPPPPFFFFSTNREDKSPTLHYLQVNTRLTHQRRCNRRFRKRENVSLRRGYSSWRGLRCGR